MRRGVNAAHKAGLKVTGIQYPPQGGFNLITEDGSGTVRIIAGRSDNEWDEVFRQGNGED